MTDSETVHWYEHDCEWISKYCDENHVRVSIIPRGVLETYEVQPTK